MEKKPTSIVNQSGEKDGKSVTVIVETAHSWREGWGLSGLLRCTLL